MECVPETLGAPEFSGADRFAGEMDSKDMF